MVRKNQTGNVDHISSIYRVTSDSSPGKIAHTFMEEDSVRGNNQVSFFVKGMTCMYCAQKIESALLKCSRVTFANVKLSEQKATVHFNLINIRKSNPNMNVKK